jgi:hypothetical protein
MIRKTLIDLPATLDATYEQILDGISEDYHEYALRILTWLVFSPRVLTLSEIGEIAAIDANRKPVFDNTEIIDDRTDILEICSSLITVTTVEDSEDSSWSERWTIGEQIVRLAHHSVKEYLLSS